MAIASAHGDAYPVPDGAARQFLSEYGDFPIWLVNRDMRCKRTTSYQLYPLRAQQAAAQRERLALLKQAALAKDETDADGGRASGGEASRYVRDEDVVRAGRRHRDRTSPREWSVAQVLQWLDDETDGSAKDDQHDEEGAGNRSKRACHLARLRLRCEHRRFGLPDMRADRAADSLAPPRRSCRHRREIPCRNSGRSEA